jgi:hypothetical protein
MAISEALQTLVPPGIRIQAVYGDIVVSGTDLDGPSSIIGFASNLNALMDGSASVQGALESVAQSVLSQLQDIITREQRRPWPEVPGASLSDFAPPYVEVRDKELILAYATPDVTIAAVSVSLADFG